MFESRKSLEYNSYVSELYLCLHGVTNEVERNSSSSDGTSSYVSSISLRMRGVPSSHVTFCEEGDVSTYACLPRPWTPNTNRYDQELRNHCVAVIKDFVFRAMNNSPKMVELDPRPLTLPNILPSDEFPFMKSILKTPLFTSQQENPPKQYRRVSFNLGRKL